MYLKAAVKVNDCPCGSNKSYKLCCSRYHKGKIHAPTAEALMRSRYSAYVLKNTQYIYRSWDENTRPPLTVLREDNSQAFIQLEILNKTKGETNDVTGTVEFVASYQLNANNSNTLEENDNEIYQHHENSYFIKQNQHWVYVNELSKSDSEK